MNQQQISDSVGAKEYRDYRDDEIDLMELFAVLWRGKWAIMAYVSICAAIAVIYLFTAPTIYKGSLEIKPLLANDMLRYQDMNQQKIMTVSSGALLGRFITDLESRNSLVDAFKKSPIVESEVANESGAPDDMALSLAYGVSIVPPSDPESKKGDLKKYWTVEFETADPDAFKAVLLAASNISTLAVQTLYLDKYVHVLAYEKKQAQRSREGVEANIELKLASYDEKIAQRLAFLKEQAILARTLDLEKNAVEAQAFASSNSVIASLESKAAPFYMRGYKAIEKEIELLQGREDKRLHVPELITLNEELRQIEADKKVDRFKEGVEASPLSSGQFKAVRFDLNSIVFKSGKRAALILVFSVIMGGVVGVFVVLIQHGVRSYRARQAY